MMLEDEKTLVDSLVAAKAEAARYRVALEAIVRVTNLETGVTAYRDQAAFRIAHQALANPTP